MTRPASKGKSAVSNGTRRYLKLVDGRTEQARRFADILGDIEAEQGGYDNMSVVNLRTIRGPTTVAAICDEVAFWRNERSANPDAEILGALRPSLATLGVPLFVLSSPHAKKGELYATYRRDFRPDGDPRILVAKAPSRTMNPMLSERIVARGESITDAKSASGPLHCRKAADPRVGTERVSARTMDGGRRSGKSAGLG